MSDVMEMSNPGYRFNILNERAQPVLSLVFERRNDAEQACIEVAKGTRHHATRLNATPLSGLRKAGK